MNFIGMDAYWKRLCDECRIAAMNAGNGAISNAYCNQELGKLRADVSSTEIHRQFHKRSGRRLRVTPAVYSDE